MGESEAAVVDAPDVVDGGKIEPEEGVVVGGVVGDDEDDDDEDAALASADARAAAMAAAATAWRFESAAGDNPAIVVAGVVVVEVDRDDAC